jgi:hypothetical protein
MKRFIQIFAIACLAVLLAACTKESGNDMASPSPGGGEGPGKGGSMAKFSISGDHLFLINEKDLLIFDIQNESSPTELGKLEVDFGIETVFTLNGRLFIGANNGVYIYDVSNPSNILFLSHYEHITSCDPVVANDTIAYSTLNANSACRWQTGANQLDVIDIRNIVDPQLINSYQLQDPKGLALDGTYLFVCNGEGGLEIYDAHNPYDLYRISGVTGINAYDVILNNNILILIGQDGLFQYNYENIYQLELLSNILF